MKKLPRGINLKSQRPESVAKSVYQQGVGGFICAAAPNAVTSAATVLPANTLLSMPAEFGHPVVASFEPLQGWFYDYEKRKVFRGYRLASPRSHPEGQPAPGPEGRVPRNWESLLHDVT
jgi:hypothetical protein